MAQGSKDTNSAITPQTRMGDLIERWPQTVDILVANGFAPLADPAHRALVKTMPVTLEMACARHGVSLEDMLARLNPDISYLPRAGGNSKPTQNIRNTGGQFLGIDGRS